MSMWGVNMEVRLEIVSASKKNWYFGARMSIPVFDGGLISAEINRERAELQKVLEEERLIRLAITREVRDAYLNITHARERTEVAGKAIERKREREGSRS